MRLLKRGSYPILFNGANEELVAMILDGKIEFSRHTEIASQIDGRT